MQPTLLVTGFGPFRQVKVNPSWEAVRQLPEVSGWNVVKQEMAVEYASVSKIIPELLQCHEPQLVIHVGVGRPQLFHLETRASNSGYVEADIKGQVPKLGQCIPCEDDGLHTRCTRIDANCIQLLASLHDWNCVQLSKNAGRYLCEFIFYTSLYHTSVPTIFIHVPSEGWSQEDINACLHSIVKSICHHPTVRQKGWKSHLYRWYLQLKLAMKKMFFGVLF